MLVVKLIGPAQRRLACRYVHEAATDSLVRIKPPTRTLDQNARLWPMLTDVSKQKQHKGEWYQPEVWKVLFMSALGHEAQWMEGLSAEPIPLGYRSSQLSKEKFAELMDFIEAWGVQNGVIFHERLRE